jgi:hypothetical protein
MSAYYSTLNNSNGNTRAGNFGISNTVRLSLLSNTGYTSGLNNGGLLQPQASPVVSTNVLAPLASATDPVQVNSVEQGLNNNLNFVKQNASANDNLNGGPKIAPGSGVNGIYGYA